MFGRLFVSLSSVVGWLEGFVSRGIDFLTGKSTFEKVTGEQMPSGAQQVYEEVKNVSELGRDINTLNDTDRIPESWFSRVPVKFVGKYVYRFKVNLKYEGGIKEEGVWKQIESNRRLSKIELDYATGEVLSNAEMYYKLEEWDIDEWEFIERAEEEE